MSNKQCPYELLGVERNDDTKTIKKAYRKLMMKHHEDRITNKVKSDGLEGTAEGNKRIEDAKEMSASLNVAENILNDTTEHTFDSGTYTKRKVYDKFGHSGLDALQEGNDPAQARTGGVGKHSWKEAADIFGGEKSTIDGLSDDELMDGDFEFERKKRSVDDILLGAKNSVGSEFQDIDDLLEQSRRSRPKKKPKKDKTKTPSISDVTDKLGGFFNKAKEKVEEYIPEKQGNPSTNGDELASRLQSVAEEIAKADGQLSPMLQKVIIQELAEIAHEIQGNNPQQKNGNGFKR